MIMYYVKIKEGKMERYWTSKSPMEFNPLRKPLSFSTEMEARESFQKHLPLLARYIELSDKAITDLTIVKVEDEKEMETFALWEEMI